MAIQWQICIFKVQTKLDESKIGRNCHITGSNNRANDNQGEERRWKKLLGEKSNLKQNSYMAPQQTMAFTENLSKTDTAV